MEKFLYQIVQCKNLMLSYLFTSFIIGIIGFLIIRRLKHKNHKSNITIYGLFMNITNLDIVRICLNFIKIFIILYSIAINTKEILYINLIILFIIGLTYSILFLRRSFYSISSTTIQICAIYFTFYLKTISNTVNSNFLINLIYYISLLIIYLYSIYCFLSEIENITYTRSSNMKGNSNNEKISDS